MLWYFRTENAGSSLGSQWLRKHVYTEWSKEMSFAAGSLLMKAVNSWPLSFARCCCSLRQWDWGWRQHGHPLGPFLFWLRQEKAKRQPAEGIRADSPWLAVWAPIQCVSFRARKSITVPTNTPIYTTGKEKRTRYMHIGFFLSFFFFFQNSFYSILVCQVLKCLLAQRKRKKKYLISFLVLIANNWLLRETDTLDIHSPVK